MAAATIDADTDQHVKVPFDVVVVVAGAPAGAKVTATLSQKRGRPPLWGPEQQHNTSAGGVVTFTFQVTMEGPTQAAVLLAEAEDDKNTLYDSDAQRVEVR